MTENKHSIQKVFLEIDVPSMETANSIKQNLALFLQNEVVSILEKHFNLIQKTDNQTIQIEKLEIDLQSVIAKNDILFSNNDIKSQIEKEIQKTLNEFQKTTKNKEEKNARVLTISSEEKDMKTLLYFIENGSMPWWVSNVNETDFLKNIHYEQCKNDIFRIPFTKLIQQKNVQNRIINQFSNQEIITLLSSAILNPKIQPKTLSKNKILALLNQKTHHFKVLFWQSIFDFWIEKKPIHIIKFYHREEAPFSSKKISFELFIQNIKPFVPFDFNKEELLEMKADYLISEKQNTIIKSESNFEKEEKIPEPVPENLLKKEFIIEKELQKEEYNDLQSCYVQNAGLIILHPFLKELLKSCHLITDDNILINKELAAHILHYAATKRENDYEHSMLFEKFLCGIPMQQSIPREIKIDDEHKLQIEEMLDSVVQHWSALKNTSTAVLRSEFLQREGKLDLSESNPKLFIERKTQDLLLEKIPWNISIVKIPWIQKLIYTQW